MMTLLFVGLSFVMIALVSLLVMSFERMPEAAPEPPPPPPPPKPIPKSRTNPFGMSQPAGAMILSRRVLTNLPLPPPVSDDDLDFHDNLQTLVLSTEQFEHAIEIEVLDD